MMMKINPSIKYMGYSFTKLLLLSSLWMATESHAFTLSEAWESAKQYSADYKMAYFQREASMEQEQQAKSAFLPHVYANASYQRQLPSISSTRETQGWNVQLNQTLFDASKMAQYRQSQYNSDVARQRFNSATEELLLKVSELYFNLLLIKETIAVHAAEKQAYEQQLKQAQEMFKRGSATVIDIHEAQAGYDNALAQEISALTEKQILENQLNSYTGLNSQQISPIDTQNLIGRYLPHFQQYSLAKWQEIALQNNHEYQMNQLVLKSSDEAVRMARKGRLPTMNAQLGYQDNVYTSAHQNSDYRHRGKGFTASLQLSIPLYTGGELSSKIREASLEYEVAQAQLLATERQIMLAVRQAYTEGDALRYQIMAQERALKSNQLKLKSTQTGQQYGMRNRLEVIQARQEVAKVEQQLMRVQYRFLMAYLTLIKESGLGLENIWRKHENIINSK
ncbi:TolC family protein [Wielerella bovis]|uniref:TolC family protein n=1 Tax=Wielerella bovis TaxID=2917790 RepID=UPI003D2738B9